MSHVFVFGSNLAGIHGAGAARYALDNFGAVLHEGVGHHGNSYAIPTKDKHLETLSLFSIEVWVEDFVKYAREHSEFQFQLTAVGTGLAGHKMEDMRDMFYRHPTPPNVTWPPEFLDPEIRESVWNAARACFVLGTLMFGPIKPENINPTIKFLIDKGYYTLIAGNLFLNPVAYKALEFYRGFQIRA